MLKHIPELFPPAVVIGGAVYAAVTYFAFAPELGERIFEAHYRAPCEANLLAEAERQFEADELKLPKMPAELRNSEIGIAAARGINDVREGIDLITNLFGGPTYDALLNAHQAALAAAKAEYYAKRDAAKAEMERRAEARIAAAPTACSCQARRAIEADRTDWALFAGSMTLFTPPTVADFPVEMAQYKAACLGADLS
ncbi:MAG: hypothetical protein AAGF94_09115 [Pseudomonadota bacterium]